jgi:hypothetical protein
MTEEKIRQASPEMYRIVGYDCFDYTDYVVDECDALESALSILQKSCAKPNAIPVTDSNVYFIYDDKGEALYRCSYSEGLTNCKEQE